MEQMEQEISLREIIEIIWNGKWMIAAITGIAIVISGMVSFFILDPVYEARSTISVSSAEENSSLAKYVEQVLNHAVMTDTINRLELYEQEMTITGLREKISTETIKDTSLIRIKVTDGDPEMASAIVNQVADSFIHYMKQQEQEELKNVAETSIERIDSELQIHHVTLNKIHQELNDTPEFIITQKSLAQDSYLHAIESERRAAAQAGSLQLLDEEINPVYTSLQQSITSLRIDMEKLEARKAELKDRVEQGSFISSQHIIVTSPAIPPERPIGPRKALNVAIAAVVGGMTSMFIVFFRHYWQASAPSNSAAVNRRMDGDQGLPL